MFRPSNVKVVAEKRPISTLLMGIFILSQVYDLSKLAISDGRTHPGYVMTRAVITIVGVLIWLDGLKSGDMGMTVLKYIGFLFIAAFVRFFAFAYSYGETKTTTSSRVSM